MFDHAYNSYMTYAFPADELMPLSCQGRYRGNRPSRGDVDESLGNFTLTLVDTLDTLALLGKLEEFETAVRLVLENTWFDTDVVVSVFETNIRMLGGLLGGHVAAIDLKAQGKCCEWYTDELLKKALDLGERLLPAFSTSSGIPYPKVNLKTGLKNIRLRDTCTACAGTIVLEFAALSRMTGDPRFEDAAHKAMDFLWKQRNVHSNLMGTVLNVNSGDWVRRESGIGAGIDSYYEYLLKAYILLGDDVYLTRFNKHYDAIMMYINQGPLMLSVDMHKPTVNGRNIMDSLLAFWPGLQVLKGDLKSAIEMHEVLYQITQRHNFLPEAVTADFHVHWGQHPLRPEFVESTYFLYKATGDPHYLDVGRTVLENLEKHARVPCGFAAIKDVRGATHEDQMDSFVLAETFKYLYLLFEEEENLALDVSQYIFTTEAHILPLSLANQSVDNKKTMVPPLSRSAVKDGKYHDHSCPNIRELSRMSVIKYAQTIRSPLKNFVELKCPKPKPLRVPRLRAVDFVTGNAAHANTLATMGVQLHQTTDGRIQLTHAPNKAMNTVMAEEGLAFMKEMLELAQTQQEVISEPRILQILPSTGAEPMTSLPAGPAQFGWDFNSAKDSSNRINAYKDGYKAQITEAEPFDACQQITNGAMLAGKIALVMRGSCTFVEKARLCEKAGAVGVVVIDNVEGSSKVQGGFFQMSGDGTDDVSIPVIFLFSSEAMVLTGAIDVDPDMEVYIAKVALKVDEQSPKSKTEFPRSFMAHAPPQLTLYIEEKTFAISASIQNALSDREADILTDSIEVTVIDEKPTLTMTVAKILTFDVDSEVTPAKGELYEAILDLISSHLVNKCKLTTAEEVIYLPHISSILSYVYRVYANGEDVDPPRSNAETQALFLIKRIADCEIKDPLPEGSMEGQSGQSVTPETLEADHEETLSRQWAIIMANEAESLKSSKLPGAPALNPEFDETYPKKVVTHAPPLMNMYVEGRNFAISFTIQNRLSRERDDVLTDSVEVDMVNGKLTMTFTPAKVMHFSAQENILPSKREILTTVNFIIGTFLASCKNVEDPDAYQLHISDVVQYILIAYGAADLPTDFLLDIQRAEESVVLLLQTISECHRDLSGKGLHHSVKKVTDLDPPHVGALPEFYSKPASPKQGNPGLTEEEAIAMATRAESFKSTTLRKSISESGSLPEEAESSQMVEKPPKEVDVLSASPVLWRDAPGADKHITRIKHKIRKLVEADGERLYYSKQEVTQNPRHDIQTRDEGDIEKIYIVDSLNEVEADKHIESIAPESERAGKYSKHTVHTKDRTASDYNGQEGYIERTTNGQTPKSTGKDEL